MTESLDITSVVVQKSSDYKIVVNNALISPQTFSTGTRVSLDDTQLSYNEKRYVLLDFMLINNGEIVNENGEVHIFKIPRYNGINYSPVPSGNYYGEYVGTFHLTFSAVGETQNYYVFGIQNVDPNNQFIIFNGTEFTGGDIFNASLYVRSRTYELKEV